MSGRRWDELCPTCGNRYVELARLVVKALKLAEPLLCRCDVERWVAEQTAAGLKALPPGDDDPVQVLRALAWPMLEGPYLYTTEHIDTAFYVCEWAALVLEAWEGRHALFVAGHVNARLSVALMRARVDPEWFAASEAMRQACDADAWVAFLSLAGWPQGVRPVDALRSWRAPPVLPRAR